MLLMTATAAGSDRLDSKTRKRSTSIHQFIRRSDAGKLYDTLVLLFRVQGLSGLYVGVLIHLVHTTLRGALSMSLRTFGAAPEAARGNA